MTRCTAVTKAARSTPTLHGRTRTTRRPSLRAEARDGTILVVAHSLPIAYVLMALAGLDPAPRVPLVEHAKTHTVSAGELTRAIIQLEAWCDAPSW
jgi:broad specificity phosphatase PhoE